MPECIRLLASDKDGDVVAAWHGLIRKLNSIGADIHDLAERVERSDGDLSEAEMEKVYSAGIEEGRRLEKRQRASQHNGSHYSPPQFPSPRDMALHCYRNIAELNSEWEHEFVTNMASWTRTRPLSPKQQAHLEKIYIKLRGRI